MEFLNVLRKKGRTKRLYSQANVVPKPEIAQADTENIKEQPTVEKRNHISEEQKDVDPLKNILVTLPLLNHEEKTETNSINDQVPIESEVALKSSEGDNLIQFTIKPFMEYNQQLGIELLMKDLNFIRENNSENKHRECQAIGIMNVYVVPKFQCVLPPFDDVILNEKRICCEVWKAYREQAHNSLSKNPQGSALLLDWMITNTSSFMLDLCNDYQTKAEELVQQKIVRPEPRNQVSHTLIQCAEVLNEL